MSIHIYSRLETYALIRHDFFSQLRLYPKTNFLEPSRAIIDLLLDRPTVDLDQRISGHGSLKPENRGLTCFGPSSLTLPTPRSRIAVRVSSCRTTEDGKSVC